MEMKDHHHLLQPLISTTTTTSSAYHSRIAHRYILFFFIVVISIWANYQASQGFEIFILNDLNNTPAGRKFHLLFISNDKASQIILQASKLAENVLYPDDNQEKKPVRSVTLRLTDETLTGQVSVKTNSDEHDEYVVHVNSSVMEEGNVEKAMVFSVGRAMARVWLWNGQNSAPSELIDAIVEYVNVISGATEMMSDYSASAVVPETDHSVYYWKNWDKMEVVQFLRYCENMRNGFIGRLNQAMKGRWNDQMVEDALGVPVQTLCTSYYSMRSTASI